MFLLGSGLFSVCMHSLYRLPLASAPYSRLYIMSIYPPLLVPYLLHLYHPSVTPPLLTTGYDLRTHDETFFYTISTAYISLFSLFQYQ